MSTIGKRIKAIRLQKDMSQIELAKKLGVEQNYISRFEGDLFKNPTVDTVERFAKALKVHPNEILYDASRTETLPPPEFSHLFRFIPLLSGTVPAGAFQDAVDEWDGETLAIAKEIKGKNLVAWKVHGQSMEPNFLDGDNVIIDLDFDIAKINGCDIVARINGGEVTLKNIKIFKDGSVELRPYNTEYKTITFKNRDDLEIVGVVTGFHRNTMRRKK